MILCGEADIYINNNHIRGDTYLDTLYPGCNIGAYSILVDEVCSAKIKSVTDLVLLAIDIDAFTILRYEYDELDKQLTNYEEYTEK